MTNDQLNQYIKNYLENDKTQSAIMITADWGTGKSYYIKNKLVPFLDSKGKKCIVISLYGLSSVRDISKNIYMELKFGTIKKKSEWLQSGKILAKTVVNGVASLFNINFKVGSSDLDKLYKSVDLTGKLIILEDIERSGIDVVELLGYVNSLVEQDGVKVLLVANEQMIIKCENAGLESSVGENSMRHQYKYLEIKEKTVSDTIRYNGDTIEAIENIMKNYSSAYFDRMLESETPENGKISTIIQKEIMSDKNISNNNLRSFMLACQKTVDLLNASDNELNYDFVKALFLGNVAYFLKHEKRDIPLWDSNDFLTSEKLGTYRYPLYRVAYKYNCYHEKDSSALMSNNEFFKKRQDKIANQGKLASILNIIYAYYLETEKEVVDATSQLKDMLQLNNVPYEEYLRIANFLISMRGVVPDNIIEDCKLAMTENLRNAVNKKEIKLVHDSGIALETVGQKEEFENIKKDFREIIDKDNNRWFEYDYSVENFDFFCSVIQNRKREVFLTDKCFMSKIDIEKLLGLLTQLSARQIYKFNGIIRDIYYFSNVSDYFAFELPFFEELNDGLKKILTSNSSLDKIKVKQIEWFISNIKELIGLLKRNKN